MRNLLLFLFVFLPFFSEGQARYFVYLKDKSGSHGRVDAPSSFLSQRAIDRRLAQNISITERDLPVSKTYLDEIQKQGFKIIGKSKWLNAVLVDGPASQFTSLKSLAFVSGIEGEGDIRKSNVSVTSKPITIEATTKLSSPVITSDKQNVCGTELANLYSTYCQGTVLWSNGLQGPGIQVGVGSYSARCSTDCETSPVSNTISIGTSTQQSRPSIFWSDNSKLCSTGLATLSIGNCNGTVTWSTGSKEQTIQVKEGSYTASCSSECGTTEAYPINIRLSPPPGPSISTNRTLLHLCGTELAEMRASGCSDRVSWSNGSTESTIWVGPGTYTAKCITDCGVSVESTPIMIAALPGAPPPVINTDKITLCGTETATLTATGCTGTINWSNGLKETTIQVKEGTYFATCTTDDCETSIASNSITITTWDKAIAPVITTDAWSVCEKKMATLTATGCSGTVTWSNGLTGNTIQVSKGTYSATCTMMYCGIPTSARLKSKFDSPITPVDYGSSANQIKMIGADTMHAAGFTGEGILIAVMDAGFPNVNTADAFAHLRSGNKIKRTYNFVEGSTNVYRDNAHGTNVLSIITALLPGKLLGTAPLADVALYTTEDNSSETKQEEVYWTFAAEDADSLGVDVINTSLGYSQFDDENQNYTYEDMDGQTTIMVRAANYATQAGIIVVNSAGNEGNSSWKYISTPADGDLVIAVGAVSSTKVKSGFSSFGPSADGRIKPDVTAMGQGTSLSNSGNTVNSGNGTSYSSPLIAGFMAGLKQQFPTLTSLQLRELLIRSADRYSKPDNEYGYGIPSYTRAVQIAYQDYILLGNEQEEELAVITYPNPISDGETLKIKVGENTLSENQTVNLTDNSGRIVYKQVNLKSLNLKPLSSGIYHLSFNVGQKDYSQKLVVKK